MGEATFPYKLLFVLLLIGLCSCQEPPRILDCPPYITVAEDIPNNTVLYNFTAIHPNGQDILIHTVGATTEDMVYIDQTHGDNIAVQVVTKSAIDRDGDGRGLPGADQVTLVLKATDVSKNEIFLHTTLYINDVNDNVPVFKGVTYTWKLDELPFNGNETFDDIQAADVDKSINGTGGIRYFMNPSTQSESTAEEYRQTFEMDNKTGRVFLRKALDYQKNSYYQFSVTARDRNGEGNISEPVDLIIRVLDVQNSPPFFTGQPYRQTIQENIPLNSDVIKITARDGDTGVPNPVNYTVLPGNCSTLFNISHGGEIKTAKEIDRDAGDVKVVDGVCVLIVLVEEENTYPQEFPTNATTEVTITIEDVNDNVPEFENNTYTAEVQENTPNNVPITLTNAKEITVFDIDQGINARLDLSLEYLNGSKCDDFSVTPNAIQKSGSTFIKVVNQDILDFESVQNISFLIIAKEMLNQTRSATATILLNIIDMNDNNPQFENSSYSFSIPENSCTNTSVGQITATDKDSGEWGNITYTLSGGNDRFFVEKYTGVIRTSCNICSVELDREKVDVYYLTYTATDHGGRSNSTSLVIHITDKNDNDPEFTRDSYTAFIVEDDPKYNSTPVVQIEAHDNDEEGTNNSKIVYTILDVSEDTGINITVDGSSGKVYFLQPVDFEKLSDKSGKINVTIEARDLGEQSRAQNTTVVITVEDINDNSPTFNTSTFGASVPENTSSNFSSIVEVTSVYAEDKDGTERNNKIQYFIISGAMDHFTINPNTGVVSIQINAKLDRERIPEYNITIMAIDRGYPQLNGSATLIIDILDVNDELPVFNLSEYKVNVIENAAKESFIITCLASDPDTDSDLRYSIVDISATDEAGANVNQTLVKEYFKIDKFNGSVYINEPPDREVAKTITLKIQAEDENAADCKPQIANVTLTVTLLDINDNLPEFTLPSYSVSVSENAQNATILLTIAASDKDENRTITFEIIKEPNKTALFYLHPNSGILQKHGPLDREEKAFIVLNVSATDNGVPSLTSYAKVNVTVLDFNDNAPYFVNFTDEVSIQENATRHTFVHKVTALDDDIGPNENVTYSFEDVTDSMFRIDSLNGTITVNGSLDRETKSVYALRIKAQDNPLNIKEQKTTLKTLTVKLIDVNDNTPQFDKSNYSASISESTNEGSSVIRILATDKDEADTNNSRVSYSFSNETSPAGLFRIDRETGVIHVNTSLIGNVGSYILGLIAEDHGEPRRINNTVVNITVLDFNYNTPYITNIPSDNIIKVYECVDEGYTVYRFNYSDDDTGINAQADFNISGTEDSFISVFNSTSDGILQVKQKLNFNKKSSYAFQVQVTDRGIPKLSSDKVQITIKVLDVDDHLPSFNEEAISFGVKENQPAGEIVGTVTADDLDNNSVACYFFKDNNTNQIFDIGTNNGSIVTMVPLDYENKTHYSFTVGVKDCSLSGNISECGNVTHIKDHSYNETINVTVRVVDVNDNPPVFKVNEISVGMRRKTEVNTTLDISLKTNDYIEDKDTDENGRQAWVFTNEGDIMTSSSLAGKIGLQSGVMNCTDKKRHIVCVSRNGSLINNKYYSEDISGYFIVPVKVTDAAGNDTVNVKIFLISDSQILVMTLYGPKEEIAEKKNEILEIYSKVTGYSFVFDWLEDHKTADGRVETFKTDLYFHVVDSKTEQALSASEALRVVDSNYEKLLQAMQHYQVLEIVSSEKLNAEEDESEKTIYILAAVIALLTVSIAIIIYVSITTRNAYKRKLKAATVKPHDIPDITEKESSFIPGSNIFARQSNPLLDANIPEKIEYDTHSMGSHNSLDSNGVGEPRKESDYDQQEEKEVRMDVFLEESNMSMESPLDAALKQYEMQSKLNKVDNNGTESVVSPHDIEALAFDNTAFIGDFESTEI